MATKLEKARASVNQWQKKIDELRAQVESVDADLQTRTGAMGLAILDGADVDALTGDVSKIAARKAALESAVQAAQIKHGEALRDVKTAEREDAITRIGEIQKASRAQIAELKATLTSARQQYAAMRFLLDEAVGLSKASGANIAPVSYLTNFEGTGIEAGLTVLLEQLDRLHY
jgi:predicted  nucleic acid-binding Zn-ribbon protein